MTQEDKELLLRDLCARLPYGVICEILFVKEELKADYIKYLQKDTTFQIKPYLRPMSSMSKEEEDEWCGLNIDPLLEAVGERHTRVEDLMLRAKSQYKPTEWLNAHHFDYRNLIEKGLAIEVTEENNPYKK